MSRSDGKIPSYTKLKLDPDTWPENYWEKSCRCAKCGTAWPYSLYFNPTPCCGQTSVMQMEPPDMRWPEAVRALLDARFERFYEEWNEGVSDDLLREDLREDELDENKISQAVDEFVDDVAKERSN